jgi:hypothetical protein
MGINDNELNEPMALRHGRLQPVAPSGKTKGSPPLVLVDPCPAIRNRMLLLKFVSQQNPLPCELEVEGALTSRIYAVRSLPILLSPFLAYSRPTLRTLRTNPAPRTF